VKQGILSVIGNTPIVELTRIFSPLHFRLFAKLEAFNPGGSMKDRPALNILMRALEMGSIAKESVIIESSSGNMGIGLAQACRYFGLRFICVVDSKTTIQNVRLLEAYGAEVDIVSQPDPVTGEYLQARLDRVRELVSMTSGAFWPNQYSNSGNPAAHHKTMDEIVTALEGAVDYLFCATSTCGTLRGCSEYIRDHNLRTRLIAVDAVGSVIFGSQKAKRLVPGHGSAVVPPLFSADLADGFVQVNDLDCVAGCRRLAQAEAILAGGSSGAVITAVERIKESIPYGATCAVILADRGERYLDTIFSDDWVEEHFGNVSNQWKSEAEGPLCATVAS
jgi:cysteine synthase A